MVGVQIYNIVCKNPPCPPTPSVSVSLDDFSGPAESSSFPLGSLIHITASVEQQNHQPLLLLLDECIAATTPELQPDSHLYPIITNKGCSLMRAALK